MSDKTKAAVSNGTKLLAGVDGRSPTFRRYRDVSMQVAEDLGGDLSEGEMQLCRRVGGLSTLCEGLERDLINGDGALTEEQISQYVSMTGMLGRTLGKLGLRRRARDISPIRSLEDLDAS